jgi:hypothetical protein
MTQALAIARASFLKPAVLKKFGSLIHISNSYFHVVEDKEILNDF